MNKLMLVYISVDFIFLLCGGLLISFSLINEAQENSAPLTSSVVFSLLLDALPLSAGVANAVLVFVTFVISLPALALPMNRGWLKLQGWLVVACSIFTLVIGLVIWFFTLQIHDNLSAIWASQSIEAQSLIQQRLNCCGFVDSETTFITDSTCPNSLLASQKTGCVTPLTSFANSWIGLIFTSAFGIVGVDVLLLLCVVMVIKHRGELERYRHIDEKLDREF